MTILKTLLTSLSQNPIELIIFSLIALGITYIIVGSALFEQVRLAWCFATQKINMLWYLVICPPCNSFWVAFGLGLLIYYNPLKAFALAIMQCGLVAIIQLKIGGYGLAATAFPEMDIAVAQMNHFIKDEINRRKGV